MGLSADHSLDDDAIMMMYNAIYFNMWAAVERLCRLSIALSPTMDSSKQIQFQQILLFQS